MIIFDLLLIVVVLAAMAALAAIVVSMVRGRFRQARQLLALLGAGLACYLGIVVAVALVSPQRSVALKEDRCFDDWCVAVDAVTRASELGPDAQRVKARGVFYVITLRLSNHARGRAQRAASAAVHLLDGRGLTYDVSAQGQAAFEAQAGPVAPLTSTLPVGQFVTTVQVFDLPLDARDIGLTIEHPVGLSPGWFVIGDEASLLHRPTIVRLP
jgi:hypothetical protein